MVLGHKLLLIRLEFQKDAELSGSRFGLCKSEGIQFGTHIDLVLTKLINSPLIHICQVRES